MFLGRWGFSLQGGVRLAKSREYLNCLPEIQRLFIWNLLPTFKSVSIPVLSCTVLTSSLELGQRNYGLFSKDCEHGLPSYFALLVSFIRTKTLVSGSRERSKRYYHPSKGKIC